MLEIKAKFITSWYQLQIMCMETNDRVWGKVKHADGDSLDTRSRKLLQIVGEVIEAQDALRIGNPASEKIPEFTSEEEEIADVVLRIMDYADSNGLRIPQAMWAKAEFNKTRPIRHGGKLF